MSTATYNILKDCCGSGGTGYFPLEFGLNERTKLQSRDVKMTQGADSRSTMGSDSSSCVSNNDTSSHKLSHRRSKHLYQTPENNSITNSTQSYKFCLLGLKNSRQRRESSFHSASSHLGVPRYVLEGKSPRHDGREDSQASLPAIPIPRHAMASRGFPTDVHNRPVRVMFTAQPVDLGVRGNKLRKFSYSSQPRSLHEAYIAFEDGKDPPPPPPNSSFGVYLFNGKPHHVPHTIGQTGSAFPHMSPIHNYHSHVTTSSGQRNKKHQHTPRAASEPPRPSLASLRDPFGQEKDTWKRAKSSYSGSNPSKSTDDVTVDQTVQDHMTRQFLEIIADDNERKQEAIDYPETEDTVDDSQGGFIPTGAASPRHDLQTPVSDKEEYPTPVTSVVIQKRA